MQLGSGRAQGAHHEVGWRSWQGCRLWGTPRHMKTLKSFAVGACFFATSAGATGLEKAALGPVHETCSCKGKGDCTCPKGTCKCKNCGNGRKARMFDPVKGAQETTILPETARYDARGGVFI
jgi:hypothetical protein